MFYQFLLYSRVSQLTHTHISPPFWISFLFRSPRSIEQSSLNYIVGSHQLFILCIVSILCICQSQSPNSSHLFPTWYPYVCSPCLHHCFCFAHMSICTVFLDSTYMHLQTIFTFVLLTYFSLCISVQVQPHLCK